VRSPATRALLVAGVVLGGAVAAQVLVAAPASAHDELLRTDPAAGSTVATVPSVVVLTFTEPPLTLGLGVDVEGPAGGVSTGAPTVDDSTVRQQLTPDAPAGTYTVRWRVTADDGHPVTGAFTFVAAAALADPTGSPATVATAPSTAGTKGDDMPPLLWWAIIGAGLVLVAGAATLALTRRRSAPADETALDHAEESG
jgi:methionine-rich copper-binding protein CopC